MSRRGGEARGGPERQPVSNRDHGVVELVASAAIIVSVFFQGGGAGGDRTLSPPVFGVDFAQQIEVYYLVVVWTGVSIAAMYLFTRTPIGRMANAVRDNPERAEFVGYSSYLVRLISFMAAGFFAGVAGLTASTSSLLFLRTRT